MMILRCYKNLFYLLCCLALSALICPSIVHAEEKEHPGIGISAGIQGDQTSIILPWWVNEKVVLTPSFAIIHVTDVASDFQLALGLRSNLNFTGKYATYFQLKFGVLVNSPDYSEKKSTDFIMGFAIGGEYFLDREFSVTIEGQLNLAISDENSLRFSNPDGMNANTATAIMATYYF